MTRATKKTAAKLARLRELVAAGASHRAIAGELGLASHRTAAAWIADLGLVTKRTDGTGTTSPVAPPAAPSPPSPTAAAAELLADDDLDLDAPGAIAIVRRRLATVRELLDTLGPLVTSGGYPPAGYATLVNLEATLASRLVELQPPAPPDPERDPTNLDAADRVRRKLERLVEAVEERERADGRCSRCGHALPATAAPAIADPTSHAKETPHVL